RGSYDEHHAAPDAARRGARDRQPRARHARARTMSPSLEQAIADARERASEARRLREDRLAAVLEDVIEPIARAAEDLLVWLPEDDAMLRSAHARPWLRARFAGWMAQGHARMRNGRREYLQVVVPRRANPSAAREAGREAGRKSA